MGKLTISMAMFNSYGCNPHALRFARVRRHSCAAESPMPPSDARPGRSALYPGLQRWWVGLVRRASKTGHLNTALKVILLMRAKLVELYAHVLNLGLQKTIKNIICFCSSFFSRKKNKKNMTGCEIGHSSYTHRGFPIVPFAIHHLCMSRLRQQLLM